MIPYCARLFGLIHDHSLIWNDTSVGPTAALDQSCSSSAQHLLLPATLRRVSRMGKRYQDFLGDVNEAERDLVQMMKNMWQKTRPK